MELCEIKSEMDNSLANYKDRVNRELLDKVELLVNQDIELKTNLFDNLTNFRDILQEGHYSITNFINSSLYVSYCLLGITKISSYSKVYPDRIAKFKLANKSNRAISSIINAYHESKLVQTMFSKCYMPSHLLYRDVFIKAMRTQEEIIDDPSVSATVRQKAACSLMGHLKEPEIQKVELEVTDVNERDMIKELLEATNKLANQQRKAIKSGDSDAGSIAHSDIIEGEFNEKE